MEGSDEGKDNILSQLQCLIRDRLGEPEAVVNSNEYGIVMLAGMNTVGDIPLEFRNKFIEVKGTKGMVYIIPSEMISGFHTWLESPFPKPRPIKIIPRFCAFLTDEHNYICNLQNNALTITTTNKNGFVNDFFMITLVGSKIVRNLSQEARSVTLENPCRDYIRLWNIVHGEVEIPLSTRIIRPLQRSY